MNRWIVSLLTVGAFLAVTAELLLVGVVDRIADDLHIDIASAGQLVTSYALAFAIGTPVVVALTAKLDRKKVMLTAFFCFIAANLIAYWSPSYAVLMVSRALLGVSGGVYAVVAMGAISKLVSAEKLGRAIGTFTTGLSSSLVFGVPLGVALSGWMGWREAFGILAVLSLPILIGIARAVPAVSGEQAVPWKEQLSVFRNGKIASGFGITLLWGTGFSTVYTFITPFLRETVNMDTAMISLTMFVLGVFSIAGSRLGGYGADRFGVETTIYASLLAHALALLLLPASSSAILFVLTASAVWFTAAWITSPAIQTYFIRLVPRNPDLALSFNTSVMQIGFALGAGIGGAVVDATGIVAHTPWAGGCIILLAVATAWLSFSRKGKTEKPAKQTQAS